MRGPLVKGQKILFYFRGISANKKHEKNNAQVRGENKYFLFTKQADWPTITICEKFMKSFSYCKKSFTFPFIIYDSTSSS